MLVLQSQPHSGAGPDQMLLPISPELPPEIAPGRDTPECVLIG